MSSGFRLQLVSGVSGIKWRTPRADMDLQFRQKGVGNSTNYLGTTCMRMEMKTRGKRLQEKDLDPFVGPLAMSAKLLGRQPDDREPVASVLRPLGE